MPLARKTGEVKYVRKIRFISYPAGKYDPNTRYVCNEYSGPFVELDGQYYAMYIEGTWLGTEEGRTPKQDYAWFGNTAIWRLMDKYKAIYTEILFADFAKLDQAIFYDGYMFSQQGTDADGNPSSNYQDFATGNFIPNLKLDFLTGRIDAQLAYIIGTINALAGKIGGFTIQDGWIISNEEGCGIKFAGDKMQNYFEVKTNNRVYEIDGGINGISLQQYNFRVKHNRKSIVNRDGLDVADIYIANLYQIAFRPFFTNDSSIRYGYQYAGLGSGHYISDGIVEGTCWAGIRFSAANQIEYLKLVEVGNRILVSSLYDNDIILLPSWRQVSTLIGVGFVDNRSNAFTFELTFINKGVKTVYIAGRNTQTGTGQDMNISYYPKLYDSSGTEKTAIKGIALSPHKAIRIILENSIGGYNAFQL